MGGKNAKVHKETGCGYRYWPLIWSAIPITTIITTYAITCTPLLPTFNSYITTATTTITNQFNPFFKLNPFSSPTLTTFNTTSRLFVKSPTGFNLKYQW